ESQTAPPHTAQDSVDESPFPHDEPDIQLDDLRMRQRGTSDRAAPVQPSSNEADGQHDDAERQGVTRTRNLVAAVHDVVPSAASASSDQSSSAWPRAIPAWSVISQ